MKICVIIPAHNEEESIGKVIQAIPNNVHAIIVVNNNSSDGTLDTIQKTKAIALNEPRLGYGYACLKGMEYISQMEKDTDIVVFLDGDYSDYPEELPKLVDPIVSGDFDFVLGSRVKTLREKHSMTPQQIFGNWLATFLMKLIYGSRFTDLGPFRAIKYDKLKAMQMEDKTYGWTVEMQLKALKQKIKYSEIPVRYRKRIGFSKVSGTIRGSVGAGVKILVWIFKYTFKK